MKYKGFVIRAVPEIDPEAKNPKPAYYEILDPMEGGKRWSADSTIPECKKSVDNVLKVMGMKSNCIEEWKKLDGWELAYPNPISIDEC